MGLLAAFDAGIADPLAADEPRVTGFVMKQRFSKKELRAVRRKEDARRALAERSPF